jgi:C4-dicarboxylate-specific signal transduction histidine kinase
VTDLRAYLRSRPNEVRRLIQATLVVDVNELTLTMFGNGDRAELMRSLDALWPDESLDVFGESVIAAFEKKGHYSSEVVFQALDGRRYETLFTVSYPPPMVQSARLLVGIIDFTQAKKARLAQERSERRYNDFFHFLPVALCQIEGSGLVALMKEARAAGVVDLAAHLEEHPDLFHQATEGLRLVEVNARMVSLLGAGSAEALIGRAVTPYWTESPEALRASLSARYSGKQGFQAQIKIRADDGAVSDALFFAAFAPVTGDDGVSLIGMIDVTDRVKAQEALSKVQSEIAHAARVSVLGELTASIAHEVNQPLTAIQTNTEASLLWLGRTPPNLVEVRQLAERTATQVQRAAEILQRIRSMAMRRDPSPAWLDPSALIEEASLLLGHELQRHDVDIRLDLASDVPRVFGDRIQIQQVVVNLAVNAIQAMTDAHSPARTLTILARLEPSGEVSVVVEDTGPGISGDALPRLFEGFFTTKKSGMGIGLPICRSIIEAHGGRIRVTNRADRTGARVSFTLPPHASDHPNV